MLVDILSRLVDSVGDPSPDVQVVDLSDIPSCHQIFLYLLDFVSLYYQLFVLLVHVPCSTTCSVKLTFICHVDETVHMR